MLMGLCEAESADGAAEMWIHFIKIGYHQFSKNDIFTSHPLLKNEQ